MKPRLGRSSSRHHFPLASQDNDMTIPWTQTSGTRLDVDSSKSHRWTREFEIDSCFPLVQEPLGFYCGLANELHCVESPGCDNLAGLRRSVAPCQRRLRVTWPDSASPQVNARNPHLVLEFSYLGSRTRRVLLWIRKSRGWTQRIATPRRSQVTCSEDLKGSHLAGL